MQIGKGSPRQSACAKKTQSLKINQNRKQECNIRRENTKTDSKVKTKALVHRPPNTLQTLKHTKESRKPSHEQEVRVRYMYIFICLLPQSSALLCEVTWYQFEKKISISTCHK